MMSSKRSKGNLVLALCDWFVSKHPDKYKQVRHEAAKALTTGSGFIYIPKRPIS